MKYKRSKQRDGILQLLRKTEIQPTADWLYQELKKEFPNLSFGTINRNLNILIEQNLVQRIPFGSTHDRYEARMPPHYYLICESCGLVQDINLSQYKDINVQAQKMSDFEVLRHRIDFLVYVRNVEGEKVNLNIIKKVLIGIKRNDMVRIVVLRCVALPNRHPSDCRPIYGDNGRGVNCVKRSVKEAILRNICSMLWMFKSFHFLHGVW